MQISRLATKLLLSIKVNFDWVELDLGFNFDFDCLKHDMNTVVKSAKVQKMNSTRAGLEMSHPYLCQESELLYAPALQQAGSQLDLRQVACSLLPPSWIPPWWQRGSLDEHAVSCSCKSNTVAGFAHLT